MLFRRILPIPNLLWLAPIISCQAYGFSPLPSSLSSYSSPHYPSPVRRYMSEQHNQKDPEISSSSSFRLGYVTDVEGNYDYFLDYVSRSTVLDNISPSSQKDELQLSLKDDDCYFVYGGDIVDKGSGDIRLCRALVSLKQQFPQRVFLLVGNRDLNKVRLTAELSWADLQRPIDDIPPPHWDPQAPTLRQYLESVVVAEKKKKKKNDNHERHNSSVEEESSSTNPLKDAVELVNTRVERLKYMLLHTLGCPDTFEFRRQELAILRKKCNDDDHKDDTIITDEQVVDSFLHEVQHPEGSLYQYLHHANVAVIVGNTIFVHGAIDQATMKFVPDSKSKFENPRRKPKEGQICENVYEWVDALNNFLQVGLQDFKNRPYWNEVEEEDGKEEEVAARTTRGGEALMALQNRPAMWGRSIISNCYGDGGVITTHASQQWRRTKLQEEEDIDNPLQFEKVCSDPLDPQVAEWLREYGIRRIVVGHKPTGDCPAVLSALYTGVEVVSADTSYSDYQPGSNSRDNHHRGVAVSVVEIAGTTSTDNQLGVFGTLKNGHTYENRYPRLFAKDGFDDSQGDRHLGIRLKPDNFAKEEDRNDPHHCWWTKAVIPSEQTYHLCRGKGRKVEYTTIPMAHIEKHLEHSNV